MITLEKRFWSKVRKTNNCWFWTAYLNNKGYGVFRLNGKDQKAHRVSYKLNIGKIPKDLFVCHHCDNPGCVNPKHLWVGTAKDNAHDMIKKGRLFTPRGEKCGLAKLKNKDIQKIRDFYYEKGKSQQEISYLFGVSQVAISLVTRGKTWTHV